VRLCNAILRKIKFMDVLQLVAKYNTQAACIKHLEKVRWSGGVVCPYCQSMKNKSVSKENRYKCYSCKRSFSVLIGTLFEATKLPLQKWFFAIALIIDAKKGISSLQLSRHLKVNKDTAWYLQRRIRNGMKDGDILNGIVEIDETYVGGSMEKMSTKIKKQKNYYPGGMQHKTPVLGMAQREGKLKLKVLHKAWGREIKPILKNEIAKESIIVTDGFGGYSQMDLHFEKHVVLNHEKKIYANGIFNMSKIEGFWAMLKRAIIGTYHQISNKYLQEYLDEIAFKFNYKNGKMKFNILINNLLLSTIPLSG